MGGVERRTDRPPSLFRDEEAEGVEEVEDVHSNAGEVDDDGRLKKRSGRCGGESCCVEDLAPHGCERSQSIVRRSSHAAAGHHCTAAAPVEAAPGAEGRMSGAVVLLRLQWRQRDGGVGAVRVVPRLRVPVLPHSAGEEAQQRGDLVHLPQPQETATSRRANCEGLTRPSLQPLLRCQADDRGGDLLFHVPPPLDEGAGQGTCCILRDERTLIRSRLIAQRLECLDDGGVEKRGSGVSRPRSRGSRPVEWKDDSSATVAVVRRANESPRSPLGQGHLHRGVETER